MSSCFGENAPALHNAHFDVGTAAFPLDLVVFWLQSGPLTITGWLICTLPFVATNTFKASSRANPSARLFVTVANFIPAASLSPEVRSGTVFASENGRAG